MKSRSRGSANKTCSWTSYNRPRTSRCCLLAALALSSATLAVAQSPPLPDAQSPNPASPRDSTPAAPPSMSVATLPDPPSNPLTQTV